MFPTGVGMNRLKADKNHLQQYVPHRRGDEPAQLLTQKHNPWCSPQAWGWTDLIDNEDTIYNMFPTGVGMNRSIQMFLKQLYNVPHRRGDEPID